MRRFVLALGLYVLPVMAQADEAAAPAAPPVPQYSVQDALADPHKRSALLDELYKRLKASPSEEDAKRVSATIEAILQQTGNAAADLFMEWGEESVKAGDIAQALDYFDGAAMLAPNAPEPYHKRAVVYYARNDPARALVDLQRAYALEPRHLGVLTGLGTVFADLKHEKEALRAYERALALDPHLEDASKIVNTLKRKVDGDGI